MDLVKRVLGDYSREVVLLLSGTNTAFQVISPEDNCKKFSALKSLVNSLPRKLAPDSTFCRLSLF